MNNWLLHYPDGEDGGGLVEEAAAAAEAAAPPEPEGPLSLSDDAQVIWEGLDEPISAREIRDGYMRKPDYTRKTQELANQRTDWEKRLADAERKDQYIQQLEQMLQQRSIPQQPQKDPLAEAWERMGAQGGIPTDREIREIQKYYQGNVDDIRKMLQERDAQLRYVVNDYAQFKQNFQEYRQHGEESANKRAIDAALAEAKVPESKRELAKRLALNEFNAFEPDSNAGETWDTYRQSFPDRFAREVWAPLRGIADELDKEDLARAKKASLPGSGGNATPSKPIKPEMDIEKIVAMHAPNGGWKE